VLVDDPSTHGPPEAGAVRVRGRSSTLEHLEQFVPRVRLDPTLASTGNLSGAIGAGQAETCRERGPGTEESSGGRERCIERAVAVGQDPDHSQRTRHAQPESAAEHRVPASGRVPGADYGDEQAQPDGSQQSGKQCELGDGFDHERGIPARDRGPHRRSGRLARLSSNGYGEAAGGGVAVGAGDRPLERVFATERGVVTTLAVRGSCVEGSTRLILVSGSLASSATFSVSGSIASPNSSTITVTFVG